MMMTWSVRLEVIPQEIVHLHHAETGERDALCEVLDELVADVLHDPVRSVDDLAVHVDEIDLGPFHVGLLDLVADVLHAGGLAGAGLSEDEDVGRPFTP